MKVAVFFVFLFFLLLKGYDYIYTGIHSGNTASTPVLHLKKKHHKINQGRLVIKDFHLVQKEESLYTDDNEEDGGGNNLFARKFKLLPRCYLTLAYLFILRYLYRSSKARLAYNQPESDYKYIRLSVLRI